MANKKKNTTNSKKSSGTSSSKGVFKSQVRVTAHLKKSA